MNQVEYTRMYEVEERHWWYVGLHELILATIRRESRRLGRPLDIFDAGCGTGRLCQILTAEGHQVSGCDFSEEALQLCSQRGVNVTFQADLNSIGLEPEKFDVITSIDVLYHSGITDDVAVMKRLHDGLKPGGMLILNLVAFEFLRSTHDMAVHTRERYTKRTLSQRLLKAGFSIGSVRYRVSLLFPCIAIYRLLARYFHRHAPQNSAVDSDVTMPNARINLLLLCLLRLENSALNFSPMPFGSSIFALARKGDKD